MKMRNNKKILMVIHDLSYGGSIYSARRICKVIKKNGYDVDVWSYLEGDFEKEFAEIGIKPTIIDKERVYNNKKIKKSIRKYDLVIVNTIVPYAVADIAKNIVPTIWYIREAQNLPWQFLKYDMRRTYALRRAENIYTVSEYAQEFIMDNYNKNVQVVHNCVEDEYINYSKKREEGKIRFLALGTVEKRKAFDVFVDAYLNLEEKDREMSEAYFAGRLLKTGVDFYEPLLERIKDNPGINYCGEIKDHNKLMQLIADSDVIVVPSLDESCSLVALEAIMMGKPLIVSENVGAKYVVKQENGWVFKTGDVSELSYIYKKILEEPSVLKRMGEESRQIYLETSSFEIYEKNIMNMIESNFCKNKCIYRIGHFHKSMKERRQRKKENDIKKISFSFPELNISEGACIALYAAGKVGQSFYATNENNKKYKIKIWVDKNYKELSKINKKVKNIDKLFTCRYEYLVIAVNNKSAAETIKQELVQLGIDEGKIIWSNPSENY